MMRRRLGTRSFFIVVVTLVLVAKPSASFGGSNLQSCRLFVPDGQRIAHYQLLAPQLSYGGSFLAYETLRGDRREIHISSTANWKRHEVRVGKSIFRSRESFESELDWFPSLDLQEWFIFVTGEKNNFDVYLGNASNPKTTYPVVNWRSNDHQPVFSPNGKDLAFISTKGRSEGTDLYVILDIDGKLMNPASAAPEPVRLTRSANGVLYPAWSPDGAFLSYTSEEAEDGVLNDGINVIQFGKIRGTLVPGRDASGSIQPIRASGAKISKRFLHLDEVAASWSPDSRYLAFYYSEHTTARRSGRRDPNEKVKHQIGILRVKRFENDVVFSSIDNFSLDAQVLDPNVDSFLRGPVWSRNFSAMLVVKDSPADDNPVLVISVPSGSASAFHETKLNRDIALGPGIQGSDVVIFSAHDRQTTSIYRCVLR